MTKQLFVNKIRTMSDSELDNELMSQDINDTGRMIVLNELSMRNNRKLVKKVPWYVGLSVVISLLALGIAVISNWQVLRGWFGS